MRRDARAQGIEGALVQRGSTGYEDIRTGMLWNRLKPARFPDAIVLAASERDVQKAIRLARSRGLHGTVRAGGHSGCGWPLRDRGRRIALSRRRRSAVDPPPGTPN